MNAKIAVIEKGNRKRIFNHVLKDTNMPVIRATPQGIGKDLSSGLGLIIIDITMPSIDSAKLLKEFNKAATAGISLPVIKYVSEESLDVEDIEETIRRFAQLTKAQSSLTPEYKQDKWRSATIVEMAKGMGVSHAKLAVILGTTERNLGRWIKGDTTPTGKRDTSLQKMKYIYYLLTRAFKENAIPKYLREINPVLGGRTPLMFLENGDFDSLEADLQQLIEGVYI